MGYDIEMPGRLASLFLQDQDTGIDVLPAVGKARLNEDLVFHPSDGSSRLAEKAKPGLSDISAGKKSKGKKTFVVTRVDGDAALPIAAPAGQSVGVAIAPTQAHAVRTAVAVDAVGASKDKGIKNKIQALYRSLVGWLEGRHARKARARLEPALNVQQLDWRGLEEVASRTKLRYGKLDHLVERALKGMDQETLLALRQQVDALDIEQLEEEVYRAKPIAEQWKMYQRRQIKWMPMNPDLYAPLGPTGEFLPPTLLDNGNFEVVKDLRRALLAVIDRPAELEKRAAEWALLLEQASEDELVPANAAAPAA
ncbi:biogenesis of lysosome-related organelles complex 1 subunit 2 [Bordetella sp. LUAb4]|uniref:biogenesis of lysosome-related organelles complex 1 subunit 2 n=1 Tax=Bordetella sp. LUAb4 TaxID=2843195 RepID=UPI001E4EA220|nr:biogenesis of lysosome-related organelles complex 1 subunit 2 [Bordetella sp. LUAb4]